ncbi:hypothetical protein SASPL_131580 [Salvia splendens]|uniref:Uncharacterized protein n=1 Tax=Salvia splendens TaxID=180675 RepID=A0A8X8ZKQ8_SALSN|nr:hypothetical protein SASPL_131580 [Salvia splendens]
MQGRLSAWLVKHGIIHRSLGFDYQGIETLQIKPEDWNSIAVILYVYGYNYLRSQCAYDVAPGGLLASVYHLTRIEYGVDQPEEGLFSKRPRPDLDGPTGQDKPDHCVAAALLSRNIHAVTKRRRREIEGVTEVVNGGGGSAAPRGRRRRKELHRNR